MKTTRYLTITFFALLMLAACGGEDADPIGKAAAGQTCATDDECASGICAYLNGGSSGHCAEEGTAEKKKVGEKCAAAEECASGICGFLNGPDGYCAARGASTKKKNGEPCSDKSECESGICGFLNGSGGFCAAQGK